ncbi:MAG: ectoine/hydroxyectoine ABC transporter permease subunit EhuD [Candidatus Krumholzibacteriia bacterium]
MIDWEFTWRILPELLRGLVVTVQATVLGMTLALALGLLWAMLQRTHVRGVARATRIVVDFVRNTPLLVQIYFFFYVMPDLGLTLAPLTTGILALGLHYSAYTAEIYRAGLEGVPRGQWEAAAALDLSSFQTFRHVILPQAIPPVVPVLGNRFIALFKDTPMLSAITVLELLQRAKIIGSESFRYLEPITLVGVLFLLVSLASAWAVQRLETRLQLRH